MHEEHQGHEPAAHESAPASKDNLATILLGKTLGSPIFSEKILLILLTGLGFILPSFFWPDPAVAPEFAKILLVEAVVLFGIFAWAAARLRDGHVAVPKSLLLGATLLILLQFVVSAFVSPTPAVSFFGSGYDIGTVNMFAVLALLLFLFASVYRTRDRVLCLLAAVLLSAVFLEIYHLARYFVGGASFLDLGIFTSATSTPVGKWNDFAALAGAAALLSLVGLYFFSANTVIRWSGRAIFVLSLFFLLLIDFTLLWLVLFVFTGGIIALAVFEGELAHKKSRVSDGAGTALPLAKPLARRLVGHLPLFAVVLLLVSFVYGSGLSTYPITKDQKSIAGIVSSTLKASPYSEVVLTPGLTYDIIRASMSDSPVFGIGPNRFGEAYLLHKTSDINITPFWDTAFQEGVGRIPSFFAMTGIVGIILWVFFLGLLFWKGRKVYALLAKDRVAAFIGFTLFILALYFWGIAFFYLPNITIFAYAFAMTGALIAFLASEGLIGMFEARFSGSKRLSFVATPVIVVVMIGAIASGVLIFRQTASLVYFNDARLALGVGNIDQAEAAVKKAIAMAERDVYWRFLASVDLAKIQVAANDKTLSDEARIAAVSGYISDARVAAARAVTADPTNFENYLGTGGVYDALGSFGIGNTFESARVEYEKALKLNPHSPRVLFLLGRVALLANDRDAAKDYFGRALTERPNYIEALSVLAQLDLAEKKPERAIEILRNATLAEPTNFVLHFTYGYMLYSVRNYKAAISELEAAVILNPVYANAKYFLGLAYEQEGRKDESIRQFRDVATLNPDNKDIPRIIHNIELGRDPLAPNIVPPEPVNELLDGNKLDKDLKAKADEKTATADKKSAN